MYLAVALAEMKIWWRESSKSLTQMHPKSRKFTGFHSTPSLSWKNNLKNPPPFQFQTKNCRRFWCLVETEVCTAKQEEHKQKSLQHACIMCTETEWETKVSLTEPNTFTLDLVGWKPGWPCGDWIKGPPPFSPFSKTQQWNNNKSMTVMLHDWYYWLI